VKSVGVLYNPGEANSVVLVALLKKEAEKRGFSVREAAVTTSAENGTAARSLIGRADAIYVPNDNTVVQGIEAIIKVANDSKIPVLAGDTGSVERGALASIGFSYYDIGREVGDRVYKVLNGAKIADIPVQQVQKVEVYLNEKAAAAIGATLPNAVKQDAKKIY
jgi:putative ABC transport system substrate-binding protein